MAQYFGVSQEVPLGAFNSGATQTAPTTPGLMSPPISAPLLQHRNSQPPPLTKNFNYKFYDTISRFWIWEVICCLVSLAVFTSMIMMLRYYDNEPVAKWKGGWNINSVAAFLTLIMKSAMLIPVAESLGQIKWDWFKTYQKVDDFDNFDHATRGSVGALLFLFRLKFRHIASIGCFIIVGAVSIDTLIQNLITTQSGLTYQGTTALVPRAPIYSQYQKQTTGDLPGDQLAPQSVMVGFVLGHSYLGISNPNDTTISLNVTCPSGECTFEKYQTLGLKHQCIESTEKLQQVPNTTFLSFGDEMQWNYSIPVPIRIQNLTVDAPLSDKFKDVGPMVSRSIVIFSNDVIYDNSTLGNYFVEECILYWAVYTKSLKIVDNIQHETTHAVDTNTTDIARTTYRQTEPIWIQPKECWVNGTLFPDPAPGDLNCTAWIDSTAHLGLQNTLQDSGFGFPDWQETIGGRWSRCNFFCMSIYSIWDAWHPANTDEKPGSETFETISQTWENIADSMTQAIRQIGPFNTSNPTEPAGKPWNWQARGSQYEKELYYVIWWRWIMFPGALVGFSLVFFIYVMSTYDSTAAWKTSSLPLLFHGFNTGDRMQMGDPYLYAEMLHAATSLETKFAKTDEGIRLVARTVYT